MGYHTYAEGAALCRAEGGSLPLPRNDEELESFSTFVGVDSTGLLIDATDMDEDGVWEDSYGNVVTYLPNVYYFPVGHKYSEYSYQYISVKEVRGDIVSHVAPAIYRETNLKSWIFCQIPLDPPVKPVYEPPAPVEGRKQYLSAKLIAFKSVILTTAGYS